MKSDVDTVNELVTNLKALRALLDDQGAFELARARLVGDVDTFLAAFARMAPPEELRPIAQTMMESMASFSKTAREVDPLFRKLFQTKGD